jgi:hypothetical protein
MNEAPDDEAIESAPTKGDLVRDALVFQFKLMIDGMRDFVLVPISLGAAVLSLLKPGAKAGSEFYEVVAFGRTTEKKINLFSVADKIEAKPEAEELPDLDSLVGEIEAFVKDEYKGDRFAAARERLSKLRESARERAQSSQPAQDEAR